MISNDKFTHFLASKTRNFISSGFHVAAEDINSQMFNWQNEVTRWALRKGRAALFEGAGLGKTFQELEWGTHVHRHTHGNILHVAPLTIAEQTHYTEGPKFGYQTTLCRTQADVKSGINITNYEMLDKFDPSKFSGVVLDESGILKHQDSSTRNKLIRMFANTPYKLCGSATPAPNDYAELGNHAEFLGVMSRVEMLSMFFIHDGDDTSVWRLKRHAVEKYWKWVCTYAVVVRKPSDIGGSDVGYDLPKIHRHQITVTSAIHSKNIVEAKTLRERQIARKDSIEDRAKAFASIVNSSSKQWIIWCGLNNESKTACTLIPEAVEVTGSDKRLFKYQTLLDFIAGKIRVLVTKPGIFGWGSNLQCCYNWVHFGLSDSFEEMFQVDRRHWRFGQQHECNCYVVTSRLEGAVVRNIDRKEINFNAMNAGTVQHMREEMNREVHGMVTTSDKLEHAKQTGNGWTAILGDSVEELQKLKSDSIHYSIFSPPFASLYTYSASERDLGNCKNQNEFIKHFRFMIPNLFRVTMPGRLLSFHCMNLPSTYTHDGFIGLTDFRGALIKLFEDSGFIFHSEVVIWKDPLVAAVRTHAIGLAHKQIVKDAAMCRQGIADFLVTMRKPGNNPEPVEHKPRGFERYIGETPEPKIRTNLLNERLSKNGSVSNESKVATGRENGYSHNVWQRYASPVWMDIRQGDTLQRKSARDEKDERHICPLQLQVIERGIELWSNSGDLILDPFAGIGSTGYVALKAGRKTIGIELKRSYFEQMCRNFQQWKSIHVASHKVVRSKTVKFIF